MTISPLLGTVDRATGAVHLERILPAAPHEVWDALTDPARLHAWLAPVQEGQPGPERTFVLRMNDRETATCTVTTWNPPHELRLTWDYTDEGRSELSFRLAELDGQTRITLAHTRIPGGAVQYGAGWHVHLDHLAADLPVAYGPRRTVLDKLLVDAASEAGAEVREGFTVEEVLVEDGRVTGVRGHSKGGPTVTEYAPLVIGADGWHSLVAKVVHPEQYNDKPRLLAGYYTYWSGLPTDGRFEVYIRPDRAFAAWPTNDDLTLVIGGWPFAEFEANKKDIEGNYLKMLELAPPFAERVRAATREARFVGTAVPNFFRKPYGPGWALVGDAGYNKDFITSQGIHDAFRDAELCATALDEAFSGARSFDVAMGVYQSTRDQQVLPMYEFTTQLATLEPPPPELQQLLGAVHGNQEAMDGFARVNAGVTSPTEFFSEENVGRIFASVGQRQAS